MKPTAADIAIVIGKIEAGDWLDPSEEPISWSCVLYDPEGERAGGSGGSRETSVTRNGGDPTIMAPPPHPKTPPISPIFTADSVTLVVSREKDGKLRLVSDERERGRSVPNCKAGGRKESPGVRPGLLKET